MRTALRGNIPCKFKFELIHEWKPSVFGENVNMLYIKTIFALRSHITFQTHVLAVFGILLYISVTPFLLFTLVSLFEKLGKGGVALWTLL